MRGAQGHEGGLRAMRGAQGHEGGGGQGRTPASHTSHLGRTPGSHLVNLVHTFRGSHTLVFTLPGITPLWRSHFGGHTSGDHTLVMVTLPGITLWHMEVALSHTLPHMNTLRHTYFYSPSPTHERTMSRTPSYSHVLPGPPHLLALQELSNVVYAVAAVCTSGAEAWAGSSRAEAGAGTSGAEAGARTSGAEAGASSSGAEARSGSWGSEAGAGFGFSLPRPGTWDPGPGGMSCLCLSYSQHCQLLAAMKQRLREGGLGAHGLSNLAWALSRWPGVEGAPGQQLVREPGPRVEGGQQQQQQQLKEEGEAGQRRMRRQVRAVGAAAWAGTVGRGAVAFRST